LGENCNEGHSGLVIKDDIRKFADDRFLVARGVAETFFSQYIESDSVTNDQRKRLVEFLQKTKYTMVSEILQPSYQHVENLSHLSSSELR
jgi:hypothetical protein